MTKSKNKLVNGFIIGTFVSLYVLVSIVSTIHVIDFFELSNPKWLAITLAIGFELGAAASLAALITLDKMNKTLVWALFIAITGMQMQGNMYYAFINLEGYQGWVELFNLLEWEPLAQKRLLAGVSGAILPLVALGFIKSLVDYIKPSDDNNSIEANDLDVISKEINHPEKKSEIEDDFSDLDVTLMDGLEDEIEEAKEELTGKDVETIIEANEKAPEPNETLKRAAEEYGSFGEKIKEDSKPQEKESKDLGLVNSTKAAENARVGAKKGPLFRYRTRKIDGDDRTATD